MARVRWTLVCFLAPVLLWLFLLIVLPHIDLLIKSFRIEADTGRLLNDLETMLADPETPVSIDDAGQLRLQRLSAERTPSHIADQVKELASRLPAVPLSELLIEIDRATDFTRQLTHAAGSQPRHPDLEHRRNLYAAILAQACNFGITRMAELCGISEKTPCVPPTPPL